MTRDGRPGRAERWRPLLLRSTISELVYFSSQIDDLLAKHSHLQHAAQHVLPMAEAVAKLMGASVTIFIVGPIPDSNGVIENRSINVNHPGGLRSQTWAQFDPDGFARAEDSFKAFGMANFSE